MKEKKGGICVASAHDFTRSLPFCAFNSAGTSLFFFVHFPSINIRVMSDGAHSPFHASLSGFFDVTILFVDLIKCENDYVFLVCFLIL